MPAAAKKLEYLEDKEASKENLEDAALLAAEAQPTGTTFETTTVQTKVKFATSYTFHRGFL